MINKNILFFVFNRYINYGLLFIRGLVLAKFLGPVSFGIWGFLTLVLQYFTYSTLGINYAVTVKLSTDNNSEDVKNGNIPSTAIILSSIISLVVFIIGLIIHFLGIPLFSKFNFDQYLLPIVLIIALSNIQQVLVNIYRVQKGILKIAVVESVSAILLFTSALIFRDFDLIRYQLWFMLGTNTLCIFILFVHLPFTFRIHWEKNVINGLFRLGIPLLIYNFSFYMITISARTVVNAFFSDEILGYYTLANSIAYAILLGFQSVAWAIYPDVLSKLSLENDTAKVAETIKRINKIYITGCFLVVLTVLFLLPLLFFYLPYYRPALPVITILMVAQSTLAASFGYNTLFVARNRQSSVAKISALVTIAITISSLLFSICNANYIWVSITVLFGSILFTSLQSINGRNILGLRRTKVREFIEVLPLSFIISSAISCIGSFFQTPMIWNGIALLIFVLLNLKNISFLFRNVFSGYKK